MSDGSQFSDDSGPKIQVKTRHHSGEKGQGQQQETRVVESKRRSFIVSRVAEQPVIPDQIKEDETEDQPVSDNFVSPENAQNIAPSTSQASIPSQQHTYETDLAYVSDNEKSLKSREKGRARVDISDLEEKLTKLTGGGVQGHLGGSLPALDILTPTQLTGGEAHSPVPSDDGLTNSQTFPQMTPQVHPGIDTHGSQPPHQHTATAQSSQQPAEHLSVQPSVTQIHTRSSDTPQLAPPPQTSFQGHPAPQSLPGQPPQQAPPQQQQQQPQVVPHPMMVPGQVPQQTIPPIPTQPLDAIPAANIQAQNIYQGYPYMPMMAPPMYMPPPMLPGLVPIYPHDQMAMMNPQAVPFVMVNVQQQNQVSQMLVPANMLMTNQIPPVMQAVVQPQPHETKQSSNESLTGSPPPSPPQHRKQNSVDSQAGENVTADAQSPLPNRSNYSIANLEQELIKKLHGNRRDIQIPSGASAVNLNESFQHMPDGSKMGDDRVNWSLSSDSVHSTELAEAAKHILERERLDMDGKETVSKEIDEDKTAAENDKGPVKKLRFSVSKVENDPLREKLDAIKKSENAAVKEDENADDISSSISVSKEMDEDSEFTDVKKLKPKISRFQVSKVKEDEMETKLAVEEIETQLSQEHKEVEGDIAKVVADNIIDEVDGVGANPASADLTNEKDITHVSSLLDTPYRKKSMSFFEGNSAMKSNNTFDAFSNSILDRYQIFHRRRTKSLGHLPSSNYFSGISNAISKHTQYGDGETPLPSPSPADLDDDFLHAIFNLDSFDAESDLLFDSAISDPESKPDSDFIANASITGKRKKLRRQSRKVINVYPPVY